MVVMAITGVRSQDLGGIMDQPESVSARPEEHGGQERTIDGLVKGLVWVGSRTEHYKQMRDFYRDALGLSLELEEGEFAVFRLPDGSKAEVFGSSGTEHTHFSTGPVAGFLVDDIQTARGVLEAEGIEFIGPVHAWESTGGRGRTFAPRTVMSTK
jgi:catechol 2,3-dioxygenase-like lactoylglutathione lyase family enzyme